MQEKVIRSTINQLKEFKDSFIWSDIVDELDELELRSTKEYDIIGEPHVDDDGYKIVPNQSETLIHLGDIKGRKKAIIYFKSIPDILIQLLEDSKDGIRHNQTD